MRHGDHASFCAERMNSMATAQKKSSGGKRTAPRSGTKRSGGTSRTSSSAGKSRASGGTRKKSSAPAPKPIRRGVGALICLLLAIFAALGYFQVKALFIDFFVGGVKGLIGYGF